MLKTYIIIAILANVLLASCTKVPKCPNPNEEYDRCPALCPPRRCDVDPRTIRCAAPPKLGDPDCKPGCNCKKNYYRNEQGVCVTREQCSIKCNENEEFSLCPVLCPPKKCGINPAAVLCAPSPVYGDKDCQPSCQCKDGFVRNDTDVCIPKEQCPVICYGENEEYDSCPAPCPPQTCDSLKKKIHCPLQRFENGKFVPNAKAGQKCEGQCRCIDGYLRNKQGVCVPREGCKCKENERYEVCPFSTCTAKNCTQLGFAIPCPGQTQDGSCPGGPGCVCVDGYLRDGKGVCVPQTECPTCRGDPNAVAGCGVYCNQKCSDVGSKEPKACILICYPNSCDCRDGYYLDENTGKCVLPNECTPVCGSDEVYSTCINGGCRAKNCDQIGKPVPCRKIDAKSCIKGCLCKEGYLRNKKGVCVPEESCPENCNKDHEVYVECGFNCPPQTCDSIGKRYSCPLQSNNTCTGICKCEKGYYRNSIGACISEEECKKCPGKHEYYNSCGGACDNVCETLSQQNQTNCPIKNKRCNQKCYCEEGYARNKDNECVPFDKCNAPVCGPDEEYSTCTNGGCRARDCSQAGQPVPCIKMDPKYCKTGCVCKEGYLRDDNGVCVPEKSCPKKCKDHEVYGKCDPVCSPQTCESIGKTYSCLAKPGKNCKTECTCESGYYRNVNGDCVSEEDCKRCPGKHEYYSCGGACDNVCENLSEQNQTSCPIVNIKCNEMCYCEEGYARNKNNECVPFDQCDNVVCPKNERYDKCPAHICDAQKCSELGNGINCPPMEDGSPCPGEPGCVCVYGYVRNKKGVCIPKDECPSCGGDKNAKSGCGGHCGNLCSDYLSERKICPLICRINSCDCKPGYVYDDVIKKCVRPIECTVPICGMNEVPNECVNGGCDRRNCSQLGQPRLCIDPIRCKKGCVCAEGYLRNNEGVCVPTENCRGSCNGDPNAVPGCGVNCNRHCSDIGQETQGCIDICYTNACDCKDGYYYDDNTKKCVLPKDCTKTCNENEYYSNCTQAQCGPKSCDQLGNPVACPMIEANSCIKGCLCKQGYLRNKKGVCVPTDKCPTCGGDPNARAGCGVNCNRRCSDIGGEPQSCITICYDNACDCKDGYYLDTKTGKCVLPENCTPKCGKDEVFNDCIQGHCFPKNCSEVGNPVACPRIDPKRCIKGCLCKDDYVRAENGTCIPKGECPSCGGDKNARPGCGVNCNKRCGDIGKEPGGCAAICYENGCDCKDGYYLNEKTGKCVRPKQCPKKPKCGKDEVYSECMEGQCSPKRCSDVGKPIPCPDLTPEQCTKGCLCKEGYVRVNNGTCIPKEECPSCGGDCNARAGCGVNCNRHCSDIGEEPKACIAICYDNACDCKDGFYLDDRGKCVRPEKCPPKCGKDEEYYRCVQGQCGPKKCSELGKSLSCPRIDPASCKAGCLCKQEYVRADNGTCIPRKECPSCGGDPHAESGCGIKCNRRCSDVGKKPQQCLEDICSINGCDCKEGYYYNTETRKCVLPKNCPKSKTTTPGESKNSTGSAEKSLAKLREGLIEFTTNWNLELYKMNPGQSFVSSPLSAFILIGQLAMNAKGQNKEQLFSVLHLENTDEIKESFRLLLNDFKDQTSVILELANKYYGNIGYEFSEQFKSDAKTVFDSEAENIDFSKAQEAADNINKWAANKTHNLIDKVVSEDMFSSSTRLALLNAIYYKGNWVQQFNPNNTEDRPFYITEEKTIQVKTMYQENYFNYGESEALDATILQMPYKGGNFSICMWLPKKVNGVESLLQKLQSPDDYNNSLQTLRREKVKVYIPVIKTETSIDVAELCKKLNITAMFDPNLDSFTGILKDPEPLVVTEFIQKCTDDINETGTEAAALTAVIGARATAVMVPDEEYYFKADREFLYCITMKKNLMFCGVCSGN